MIEQSPAVRALGAELGQAIRHDRARRVRRHRTLALVGVVLVLLAGGALRLAPGLGHPASTQGSDYAAGGAEVTAANGSRGPLPAPAATSSPPLRDAPWLHRFAAFVN